MTSEEQRPVNFDAPENRTDHPSPDDADTDAENSGQSGNTAIAVAPPPAVPQATAPPDDQSNAEAPSGSDRNATGGNVAGVDGSAHDATSSMTSASDSAATTDHPVSTEDDAPPAASTQGDATAHDVAPPPENVTNQADKPAESRSPAPQASSPDAAAPSSTPSADAPSSGDALPSSESNSAPVADNSAAPTTSERPRRRLNPTLAGAPARPVPTLVATPTEPPPPAATTRPAPRRHSTTDDESESDAATAPVETPPPPPVQKRAAPPVELPPRDDALDADVEAEIEAAMASGEMDPAITGAAETASDSATASATDADADSTSEAPAIDEAAGEQSAAPQRPAEDALEPGTRLTGKIQEISGDNVFLDLGYRSPGVVQRRQFDTNKKPQAGQVIEVVVDKIDQAENLILLNLPRGVRKVGGDLSMLSKGQVVDCMVVGTNKGGLQVNVGSNRAFLPASQVDLHYVEDLEVYVGQKLRVQVTEVNQKKRNLVVSRRAHLIVERKQVEEEVWKTIAEGQKFTGKVKTIKDYGAFVDIGSIDGFLHIGEISWQRIKHPSDVVSVGQEVEVVVVSLEPKKKKIGLGMKQLVQNPWANVEEKYPVGTNVSGNVTRTADFGAFVELEEGVEGLVHISELDHQRVRRVTDVLKVGQDVEAQVLEVDPRRKRISLSLKALIEKPEAPKDEDLAPGGDAYKRKRKGPLKGGTGGAVSGGLFGNPDDFNS